MSDISMCRNQQCSQKENCYRFTATPEYYQAYADFKQDENGNCDYYWPNGNEEKIKLKGEKA